MTVKYAPPKPDSLPPARPFELDYPESDGKPMAETDFHVTLIAYVLAMLRIFFRGRGDVYVGADMFVYYREGDASKHVAPDVFVVFGVPPGKRRSWFTWKEGKVPDMVFEFSSKETADEDMGWKKGLYAWLGVKEYFLFDPLSEYLQPRLQGYRLAGDEYQPIMLVDGQLQSETLGLTLSAEGDMLALVNAQTGERLLPPEKLMDAYEAAEAEVARLKAELERLKGGE